LSSSECDKHSATPRFIDTTAGRFAGHACPRTLRPSLFDCCCEVDRARLVDEIGRSIGLAEFRAHSRHAPEAFVGARETFRDPCLGTPRSGNHFVELQVVDEVFDRHAAYHSGLKVGDVVVMIHSGSRDLGFHVGARWMDRARDAWPRGVRHPESKLYALTGPLAVEYLRAMGVAARYAWLNRVVLAEIVRGVIAEVFGTQHSLLVVDVPHKGLGNARWLWSCSHGAGRRMRRQEMRSRVVDDGQKAQWDCITLREERCIEEAPEAYKPIGPVIDEQEEAGLISSVARLRPWVTFKA
jgi:tRNA-splicing ligase RtcB (3'-phosphate/5'-hydroxy nucleic acid ligase)